MADWGGIPEHIVRLFTAGTNTVNHHPRWWYKDNYGQLQGPFEPEPMSRWCASNELPMELLCCGVHHLDKERKPPNLDVFRPLKDLLADAQRGKAYKPLRVPAQAAAAADAPQQQQANQRRPASANSQRGPQQQQQQQPPPQQRGQQQQQQLAPAAPPAPAGPSSGVPPPAPAAAGGGAPVELVPRSPAWQEAVSQLFSRQGYTGKEADVKWRVVLPSGDRIGAFSGQQMSDWVLRGDPPKGAPKGSAMQDPSGFQLCAIQSSEYNAQRLPGLKFFKTLPTLLALIANGLPYEAVNKADIQRGYPTPNWNDPSAPPPAAPPPIVTPAMPAGKGKKGQQQMSKAAKKAAAAQQAAAAAVQQKAAAAQAAAAAIANRQQNAAGGGAPPPPPMQPQQEGGDAPAGPTPQQQEQQRRQAAAAVAQRYQNAKLSSQDARSELANGSDPFHPPRMRAPQMRMHPGQQGGPGPKGGKGGPGQAFPPPGAPGGPGGLGGPAPGDGQGAGVPGTPAGPAGLLGRGPFSLPNPQPLGSAVVEGATWGGLPSLPGQPNWAHQQPAGMGGAAQRDANAAGRPGQAPGQGGKAVGWGEAAAGLAAINSSLGPQAASLRMGTPGAGRGMGQGPGLPPGAAPGGISGMPGGLQQQLLLQNSLAAAGRLPGAMAPAGQVALRTHAAQVLLSGAAAAAPGSPPDPTLRWYVQRPDGSTLGPLSPLQLLQQYVTQAVVDSTLVCPVSGSMVGTPGDGSSSAAATPKSSAQQQQQPQRPSMTGSTDGGDSSKQAGGRSSTTGEDAARPPAAAFMPLGLLLSAVEQGLVPLPYKGEAAWAADGCQQTGPLLLMVSNGATVPFQQVAPGLSRMAAVAAAAAAVSISPAQLVAQTRAAGMVAGPGGEWAGLPPGVAANLLAQQQQQQQQQQALGLQGGFPGAAAGLPAGALGLQGAAQLNALAAQQSALMGLHAAGLQGVPSSPMTPMSPANQEVLQLLSHVLMGGAKMGGMSPVWYVLQVGGDGRQHVEGPLEPKDVITQYLSSQLQLSALVSAVPRAQAHPQNPPPLTAFTPLHALLMEAKNAAAAAGQGGAMAVPMTPGAPVSGGLANPMYLPAALAAQQLAGRGMGVVTPQGVPLTVQGPGGGSAGMFIQGMPPQHLAQPQPHQQQQPPQQQPQPPQGQPQMQAQPGLMPVAVSAGIPGGMDQQAAVLRAQGLMGLGGHPGGPGGPWAVSMAMAPPGTPMSLAQAQAQMVKAAAASNGHPMMQQHQQQQAGLADAMGGADAGGQRRSLTGGSMWPGGMGGMPQGSMGPPGQRMAAGAGGKMGQGMHPGGLQQQQPPQPMGAAAAAGILPPSMAGAPPAPPPAAPPGSDGFAAAPVASPSTSSGAAAAGMAGQPAPTSVEAPPVSAVAAEAAPSTSIAAAMQDLSITTNA